MYKIHLKNKQSFVIKDNKKIFVGGFYEREEVGKIDRK